MKIEDIIVIVKTGLNEQLEKLLLADPTIAESKTEQGISLLSFAAYCRNTQAVELLKKYKQHLDLYEAVIIGETSGVKKIINNSPNLVNAPSVDGFSPLGLSCFFGHFDIAQFLVEKGADVNLPSDNSFKVAPLHSACAISNLKIVELLLKNGANPNATQQAGITPLHEAAHNGKTALAKLLIEHKANVNAQTDDGQTPLSMAQQNSFAETALLIQQHKGI